MSESNIRALDVPKWGLSMLEGTVTKWLIAEGDTFNEGDEIAEIETDKIVNVVEAPYSGRLARIVADGGVTLPVGALIGVSAPEGTDTAEIDAFVAEKSGSAPAAEAAEATPATEASAETPATAAATPQSPAKPAVVSSVPAELQSGDDDSGVHATPYARELAEAHGINLTKVSGSGRNGRVSVADVEHAVERAGGGLPGKAVSPQNTGASLADDRVRATPSARKLAAEQGVSLSQVVPADGAKVSRGDVEQAIARGFGGTSGVEPGENAFVEIPMTGMRRSIATRLQTSKQTAPHYRVVMTAEIDALLALRKAVNGSRTDAKVSVNDFIIKACASALMDVPDCNIQFDGETVRKFDHADITVAVALPNGLITPKIAHADQKGLVEISNDMRSLVTKAKAGTLTADEFQGGTFTISNLGMFGVQQFDAIINPPQAAILAVGKGQPAYVPGPSGPELRTQLTLSLSSDHRVIDGALAATLLSAICKYLENPGLMLS